VAICSEIEKCEKRFEKVDFISEKGSHNFFRNKLPEDSLVNMLKRIRRQRKKS